MIYGWRHPLVDHHGLAWDDGVPWSTKYLDSFYFAITTPTTVGCGDRSPHTDAEKMWVCVVELCRTFIFGVMAGTLTSIISEANELSARRDRELDELQCVPRDEGGGLRAEERDRAGNGRDAHQEGHAREEVIEAIALKCEDEGPFHDEDEHPLDADQMVRMALGKIRGDV